MTAIDKNMDFLMKSKLSKDEEYEDIREAYKEIINSRSPLLPLSTSPPTHTAISFPL